MSIGAAIVAGLIGAIGAGVSASSSRRASEKGTRVSQEEREKDRKQSRFEFGHQALFQQRDKSEKDARRRVVNSQLMSVINQNFGGPSETTF